MNWTDINTYGSLASLIGIVISFFAYRSADKAKKVAQEIQDSFLFDKRIPQHLSALNIMLSKYNELLGDIGGNNSQIKTLHAQIKPELINLSDKIKTKKVLKLIKSTINLIDDKTQKPFYKESDSQTMYVQTIEYFKGYYWTSHNDLWQIYTLLNEIHSHVNNLKLDRKYLLK